MPGKRVMIGDGASDLATKRLVDLFVGYGGVTAREAVKEGAELFLRSPSLAAVLPLAGGRRAFAAVQGSGHEAVFRKGIRLGMDERCTLFQDESLRQRFMREFEDMV